MDNYSRQIFPKNHSLYPDGAVILKEGNNPVRVLKHEEYEAEKAAKIAKLPKVGKLKYDSDKK